MKAVLLYSFFLLWVPFRALAQKSCTSHPYRQQRLQDNLGLNAELSRIDQFVKQYATDAAVSRVEETTIRIPVVVHNLYHFPNEKVTDAEVQSQIRALNECFRRRNADSVKTPSYFRPLAADCNIEFYLAISDNRRRATSGIIRKYTPVKSWEADDKMKFSAEMGDDAWDPGSYLNIWVCNLNRVAGYASVPGDAPARDGVVIGLGAFGTINVFAGYEMGKTAVHEVAHWLGLKHLWGDQYCGDDGISDTPRQAGFNIECPNVINVTCGNGPYGDMYMNYMDLTSDACMNLFTQGQKAAMRSLFAQGGARHAILFSQGLNPPLISEIPLPEEDPKWLEPRLYPNPANGFVTLDLAYDPRWTGRTLQVNNLQGQTVMSMTIPSRTFRIDLSNLQAGIYFLAAKKQDGESIRIKFVKM